MANFKDYSDMDISALVEGMNAGILDFVFDDLKEVQAELVNRRMSSRYMGIISGLMREMIENGEIETDSSETSAEEAVITPTPISEVKKVLPKPISPIVNTVPTEAATITPAIAAPKAVALPTEFPKAIPRIQDSGFGIQEESNEYPTFAFLATFFKIWAWVSVAFVLGAYGFLAYIYMEGNILYISCSGVIALLIAVVSLIGKYAIAEHFRWKIDIANSCKCR
ncbi:MAG: hypothetical protein FWE47_02165 [Oscillospiraceae bacterium]|nr:hypothetical protein [Oscillospiraceae bacterium]